LELGIGIGIGIGIQFQIPKKNRISRSGRIRKR
jgi:hypothetical protein